MKKGDIIKTSTTRSCGGSLGYAGLRPHPRPDRPSDPQFIEHLLSALDRAIEKQQEAIDTHT